MTDDALGVQIAQQIATLEDIDPVELEPPLHDVVDVDALESLFGGGPTSHDAFTGSVSFDYRGYTVTVDHEGTIDVTRSPTPAQSRPGQTGATGGPSVGDARLVNKQ